MISYYSYLPAIFYEQDLSLSFYHTNPDYYSYQNHMYVPIACNNGNLVIKTTMGMSFMYLPFFTLAHFYAKLSGAEMSGFSPPYQMMIQFSGLFYLVIGLYFLRKVLLFYFTEKITAFTLLCILFGSNLFFYASVHGAMAHASGFMLSSLLIYFFIQWIKTPLLKYSIVLGIVTGLLVLIRPVNLIFLLFPLLYNVNSFEDWAIRLKLFLKKFHLLTTMACIALLLVMPQLLYWKYISGHYFFNSYVGERFYFNHPHLAEGLFGFRKGWLLYSPIFVFSLAGIVFSYKKLKEFAVSITVIFVLYVYVILSWWCWWYGGSWGLRAMIDIYPILAMGMAVFLSWFINKNNRLKIAGITVLVVLIVLNLFQTLQYRWGIIHYDGMTKEAYTDAFFRIKKSPELEKLIKRPDYDKALKGDEQ